LKNGILENITSLFENNSIQGVVLYSNGKNIYANQKSSDLLELEVPEILKTNNDKLLKKIHTTDLDNIKKFFSLYDSNENFELQIEFRYNVNSKIEKWLRILAKNIESYNNRYVLQYISDITSEKQYLQKLIENEQKYKNFIEHTSEGVSLLEFSKPISIYKNIKEQVNDIYKYGYIAECNDSFANMYAYKSKKNLIGKKLSDLHGGDDNNTNIKAFYDLVQNNYNVRNTVTEEIDSNNNKIYFLNNSVGIIRDDQLISIWGTQIDITERQKSQQLITATYKISESAHTSKNINELFESIHSIVSTLMPAKNFYIAMYDAENNLINFPYFIDEYDETIVTKKPDKGITEYVLKTGKSLLGTENKIAELISKGEIKNIGSESVVWLGVPLKLNDKTIGVLAVQSYDINIQYTDEDKNILEFVSDQVAMAIERKRSEEALKVSESKNTAIISAIPDLMFVLDYKGTFLEYHPSVNNEIFLNTDNFIGKNITNVFPLQLSKLFNTEIKKAIDTNEIQICEFPLKLNSDTKSFEARFISFDGNKILSTFRDITQRDRMMKELLDAKEKAIEMSILKTNFLSNMSHELRTPLHGILGFAQILSEDLKDSENKQIAQTIYQSGKRLMETLNLILNFSKAESDKIEVNFKLLRINDIVEETINLFKQLAINKNLNIEYHVKDIITARLDERLFRDIINNIINNAIKFTEKGKVIVELTHNEKDFILKVIDTGIGIPEEKVNLIFEEFRQESEGLSRNFEGTGLGLTLTKKYVELLNGKIEVNSKVGAGSTFIVQLPLYESFISKKNIKKKVDLPKISIFQAPIERKNVLLVENDKVSAMLVKTYINKYYNIDIVNNGEEALQKIAIKQYSAILMDINLGEGLTGVEATQRIKKLDNYKSIPIVAVTAFALETDKEEFLKYGCSHYLAKPFEQKDILGLLNEILS